MRIFESVLQHIQNDYVDEPNMERFGGALRGLAYGWILFDLPDTRAVKEYNAGNKEIAGIGAELRSCVYLYVMRQ